MKKRWSNCFVDLIGIINIDSKIKHKDPEVWTLWEEL